MHENEAIPTQQETTAYEKMGKKWYSEPKNLKNLLYGVRIQILVMNNEFSHHPLTHPLFC